MAPALRAFRRYKLLSFCVTGVMILSLVVALGMLTGIAPHRWRDLEPWIAALDPTAAPAPGSPADPATAAGNPADPRGGALSADGLPADAVVPGEFEKQAGVILGCNELVQFNPKLMIELIVALKDSVRVIALVHDTQQQAMVIQRLAEHQLPPDTVDFVIAPAREAWVRDYGPILLRAPNGAAALLDPDYSQHQGILAEEYQPTQFAAHLRLPVVQVPLTLSGGNLLHNGRGLCLSSTYLAIENGGRGYDLARVREVIQRYFHAKQWVCVPPLLGENTNHVDMYCTFAAPDLALVGQYDPRDDGLNAKLLDDVASTVTRLQTDLGPMRVVRLPMPTHRDGSWRTYTNVIYANGTVVVPQYPGVADDQDRQALAIYRNVLPGWKVVGIDSNFLISHYGSFHCVTLNVPQYTAAAPTSAITGAPPTPHASAR